MSFPFTQIFPMPSASRRASTRVLRRDASQVLARRGAAALRLDLARTSRCGGFKPMRAVWGANPPPGRRTARGGSRGTNEALSESANCLPSCSGGPWERRYALGSAVGCPAPRRAVWGRVCPQDPNRAREICRAAHGGGAIASPTLHECTGYHFHCVAASHPAPCAGPACTRSV